MDRQSGDKSGMNDYQCKSQCESVNNSPASNVEISDGDRTLTSGPGTATFQAENDSADKPVPAGPTIEGNNVIKDASEISVVRDWNSTKPHPILRCPIDLLREIFEWSVRYAQWRLKGALGLSQVCRKWREVAMATPRLWYAIALSAQEQESMIMSLMNTVLPRVRSVPAKILLFDIDSDCESDIAWEALKSCQLHQIVSIAELEIIGEDSLSLARLFWPRGEKLPIPCKRLSLAAKKEDPTSGICDMTEIVACLPGCEQLQAEDVHRITISHHECINPIKSLTVVNCSQLMWPMKGLSNLEMLYLESIETCGAVPLVGTDDFELPSLRSLSVYLVTQFPWDRLTCPQLTTCKTYGDYGKTLPKFLLRHRTITSLEAKISTKQDLCALATTADQIESFYFSGDTALLVKWEEPDLQSPPFSKLSSLYICHEKADDEKAQLSLEVFDELVKSRILEVPPFLRPLDHFAVAQLSKECRHEEWKNSPFFLNSSKTLQKEELPYIVESTRYLLRLTWPTGFKTND